MFGLKKTNDLKLVLIVNNQISKQKILAQKMTKCGAKTLLGTSIGGIMTSGVGYGIYSAT
jgi:hypothetical protein